MIFTNKSRWPTWSDSRHQPAGTRGKIRYSNDARHSVSRDLFGTLYMPATTELTLGLRPVNEIRRYFKTTYLIGWAQAYNQPYIIFIDIDMSFPIHISTYHLHNIGNHLADLSTNSFNSVHTTLHLFNLQNTQQFLIGCDLVMRLINAGWWKIMMLFCHYSSSCLMNFIIDNIHYIWTVARWVPIKTKTYGQNKFRCPIISPYLKMIRVIRYSKATRFLSVGFL